jgi:hypothetical protein
MRQAIDDFPFIGVSRMRAAREIGPDDKFAVVTFSVGAAFTVGLRHVHFPNEGSWSFFVCLRGRRCRTLRLYEGGLACHRCLAAHGLRNRVELIPTEKRASYQAPRLLARLTSASPTRLNHWPGRMLDRRPRLERALRRSLIVARQHALDEHAKKLKLRPSSISTPSPTFQPQSLISTMLWLSRPLRVTAATSPTHPRIWVCRRVTCAG